MDGQGRQHQHVAHAVHRHRGQQAHAGEAGVAAALDLRHLGHRQTRRIDAVQARGGEHIARLDVGIGGGEAQLEATLAAEGHAALLGAGVEHGNGGVLVGDERHLGREGVDAGDLPQHAGLGDHGRAQVHAVLAAAVDADAARVRVRRLVEHLGRHRAHGLGVLHLEQLAQALVLRLKLLRAGQSLGLRHQLAPGEVLGLHRALHAAQIVTQVLPGIHGRQQQALRRAQHQRHGRARRLGHLEAGIQHHQENGEGRAQQQPRQGRGALAEQRRRIALQGAEGHGLRTSWSGHHGVSGRRERAPG